MPDGESLTYAEMSDTQKDAVSHRSKAIKLFIEKFEG
jgi:inosine/xanthosine triphosphate pyrophosphatase family protein